MRVWLVQAGRKWWSLSKRPGACAEKDVWDRHATPQICNDLQGSMMYPLQRLREAVRVAGGDDTAAYEKNKRRYCTGTQIRRDAEPIGFSIFPRVVQGLHFTSRRNRITLTLHAWSKILLWWDGTEEHGNASCAAGEDGERAGRAKMGEGIAGVFERNSTLGNNYFRPLTESPLSFPRVQSSPVHANSAATSATHPRLSAFSSMHSICRSSMGCVYRLQIRHSSVVHADDRYQSSKCD